jgi:hypothetical protein
MLLAWTYLIGTVVTKVQSARPELRAAIIAAATVRSRQMSG